MHLTGETMVERKLGETGKIGEQTTAAWRAARAYEWARWFTGDASLTAYQKALAAYTPLAWEVLWDAEGDLLRLFINRVPADLGAPALLAVITLSAGHPKPAEAGRAVVATLVNELSPGHAYTVLATLADTWVNTMKTPYDERKQRICAAMQRVFRQLAAVGADRDGALSTLALQLGLDEDERHLS